jgi:uncharacterized protein YndB with AHSA1/START domain
MIALQPRTLDPQLDLMVDRIVRTSPEVAWAAWTQPEHLRRWYAPAPGAITECEIDLRRGGTFRFVICDPDGNESRIDCCYLEVVPYQRLVWTNALVAGYRPAPTGFFTAEMTLQERPTGTLCTTIAMHRDEEDRDQHEAAGFHDGWGTVLDQLGAYGPTIEPDH